MSDAAHLVRTIRNATPDVPGSRVLQPAVAREEARGNERDSQRDEGAAMRDASVKTKNDVGRMNEDGIAPTTSLFTPPSSLPIKPLTARQQTAINLLSMGKTVAATARSLGIGESTLHRWKATHPHFRAELAQRQHNLFDAMVNKLRMTMSRAVDELYSLMTSDNAFKRKEVMFEMLKLLKPQKFLVPAEPMSVEGVIDETVRQRRASRGESVADEITEEERISAIPAEWRAQGEEILAAASTCHAEPTREADERAREPSERLREASDAAVPAKLGKRNDTATSTQIARERANSDDSRGDSSHGECKESSRGDGATTRDSKLPTPDATCQPGQIHRDGSQDDGVGVQDGNADGVRVRRCESGSTGPDRKGDVPTRSPDLIGGDGSAPEEEGAP